MFEFIRTHQKFDQILSISILNELYYLLYLYKYLCKYINSHLRSTLRL